MIVDLVKKYSDIIEKYDIEKFRVAGDAYQLTGKMVLKDGTLLFFKDYLFLGGARKYSFHWQDTAGNCIVRWDNAPHYQNVPSFPYHKHIGKREDIAESSPMKMEAVLKHIRGKDIRCQIIAEPQELQGFQNLGGFSILGFLSPKF